MESKEILREFKENGFAVIENALSEDEVEELRDIAEKDKQENEKIWTLREQNRRFGSEILSRYPELDQYVRHEKTQHLIREILGPELRYGQFYFIEIPTENTHNGDLDFHQDYTGFGTEHGQPLWDPKNPYTATYVQVLYYLTDVHDCCPCFTIIPNSHQWNTREAAKEGLGDDYEEISIRGEAGTAILFNITEIHAGSPGDPDCPHGRLTAHNYVSREKNLPLGVGHQLIPEELAMSEDMDTRRYYSQWSRKQVDYARDNYESVPEHYPPHTSDFES